MAYPRGRVATPTVKLGGQARATETEDDPAEEKTQPVMETLVGPLDPSVPPYKPGDVIANKYRVDEVVGCGGMAWVLRATHLQLNQKVALKFLRFASTRDAVARFFQEGRAAARVSSEAVTRVLDVDTLPDGAPFLVMEYLDGRDLEKVVADPGWIPVTTAVDFAIQACEGLAEVHAAGIVHRDLKPANLFLTRKRNGSIRMKLLDFGISKFAAGGPFVGQESPMTSTHALMGSPVYMAPEQMRSTKNVDGRADIWSLGVILYELLSGGRSPFQGATLPEVCMRVMRETPEPLETFRGELQEGLVAVVNRCLEKDPANRFTSAASLALALAPYASYDGQLLARRLQRRPSGSPPPPLEAAGARFALPSVVPPPLVSSRLRPTLEVVGTPPLAFANPPPTQTLASNVPPALGAPVPLLPFDSRLPWAAVVISAVVVAASVASFEVGVRVSSAGRSEATTASVMPLRVTNSTPPPASAVLMPLPNAVVERPVASSAPERVYTPEELPLVQPERRAGRTEPRRLP